MFQKHSPSLFDDPRAQRFFQGLLEERFGPNGPGADVDFATIERWAHDLGRTVARRLCEQTANQQAVDVETSRPCPDCHRLCSGTVETREMLTRDGPIQLNEVRCHCPHCRRDFFPQ